MKSTIILNFLKKIILCISILFVGMSSVCEAISSNERQVLIDLYQATGGDNWVNNSGWKNEPLDADGFAKSGSEAKWYGVIVQNGVVAIDLQKNNLTGFIPASIANLPNLKGLNLRDNRLTGFIPSEISKLSQLNKLNLWHNQLQGRIPSKIGNLINLSRLNLGRNQLVGPIPESIRKLQQLEYLGLHNNKLEGAVPNWIWDLSKLETLYLWDNQFTGSIPAINDGQLTKLTNLKRLWLSHNQLTGQIPSDLIRLPNIKELMLEGNNFDIGQLDLATLNFLNSQYSNGDFIQALHGNSVVPDEIERTEVLTKEVTGTVIEPRSYVLVYGYVGNNVIHVMPQARVKFIHAMGENEIRLNEKASTFHVRRSGAMVYFESAAGTMFSIPATTTKQAIQFSDGNLLLRIVKEKVMLGDYALQTTESLIPRLPEGNPLKNLPPLADAGNDKFVEEDEIITLKGSGIDFDGRIVSYHWEQISGTKVLLANPNVPNPTCKMPQVNTDETLIFKLTVTDDNNDSATDKVKIHVNKFYNHNVILRVVRVTKDWMPYASTGGWTMAVKNGFKESEAVKYYEVAIWEETASVHLYAFDNEYDPFFDSGSEMSDDEKIAYREARRLMKFDGLPSVDDSVARSNFLKNSFIAFAKYIVELHPDSDHHLMFNGHGGPGGALFAGQLGVADADLFLKHWTESLGHNLGVIDMGGPCSKGSVADLNNFWRYCDYYIASDLPNGGYSFDEWDELKYDETSPELQYHGIFATSSNLKEALIKRVGLNRKRYEYSIENMTRDKVKQGCYLYSCGLFSNFQEELINFLESRSDYSAFDDFFSYLKKNFVSDEIIHMADDLIVYDANNKDFFEWDTEHNGLMMGSYFFQKKIEVNRNDLAVKLKIDLSGSLQNPAFSPDGNTIVFTHFRNGYNKPPSDLYTFNLKTNELKPLVVDDNSNVNLPGECWNNYLNSISFSSDREPHDEIYSIEENGTTGDEIRITNRTDIIAYEPTFSPDGLWIVFESHKLDEDEKGVITKYKLDGTSGYVNLTPLGENCKQPNWSPRGDKILYQKEENGQWDIWLMNTDGSNKTKITDFEGSKTDAVFSADGQYIFFSAENSEVELANIYMVSISNNIPIRITDYSGYDGAPSISPDGTKLIFETSSVDPDESDGTTLWLLNL